MIIVHDIFICKPGNASKMAKMFKETMGKHENVLHVLTDVTGQFHKMVMVSQYKNLAEYEKGMEMMMKGGGGKEMEKELEKMKGYNDMYQTGSREIYRVW